MREAGELTDRLCPTSGALSPYTLGSRQKCCNFSPRNTKNTVSQSPDTLFKANQARSSGSCSWCPRCAVWEGGAHRRHFMCTRVTGSWGPWEASHPPRAIKHLSARSIHKATEPQPQTARKNGIIKPRWGHMAPLCKENLTTPLNQGRNGFPSPSGTPAHTSSSSGADAARTPLWSRGPGPPSRYLPPFFPIRLLGAGRRRAGRGSSCRPPADGRGAQR